MTRRHPPKLGLWLLPRWGRGHHLDSLIGDLIEQCAQGRGGWWAWREIVTAIFIAQARRWRSSAALWLTRALWWGLTEVAIMLSVVLVTDQSRNSRSWREMIAPNLLLTLLVLLATACVGLRNLIRLNRRHRERTAIHHLMALFTVMTLGVGTLTWAATAHRANGAYAPRENSAITSPTPLDRRFR
jgi:hypothetical protein